LASIRHSWMRWRRSTACWCWWWCSARAGLAAVGATVAGQCPRAAVSPPMLLLLLQVHHHLLCSPLLLLLPLDPLSIDLASYCTISGHWPCHALACAARLTAAVALDALLGSSLMLAMGSSLPLILLLHLVFICYIGIYCCCCAVLGSICSKGSFWSLDC
jgi:hypothetical protein